MEDKLYLSLKKSLEWDVPFTLLPRDARDILAEIERLREWVNDLHSGMYINCVYCGHRYGPSEEVPASMADVLKEHIEQCPEHPMSKCKAENERLRGALKKYADRDNWGNDLDGEDYYMWLPESDGFSVAKEALQGSLADEG